MTPLAHHAGEETVGQLLLLSSGAFSVLVAVGRSRLADARDRLARIARSRRGRDQQ
jgi:hypothetical protein